MRSGDRTAMSDQSLLVVCLCAEWCSTCREYRQAAFAECSKLFPACRFEWLDVEDDAELLGDMDIDNFPTLLVARNDQVEFFGAIMPNTEHLRRLLESLVISPAAAPLAACDPALTAIARHFRPDAG